MTSKEILDKAAKLQKTKGADYTTGETNQFENFDRSASIIQWFDNPNDQVFVALIATKLARLAALLDREKEPNHESIEDTFVDLTNYCALWGGRRMKK